MRQKGIKIFYSFLGSYVVLLILAIGLAYFIYDEADSIIYQNSVDKAVFALKQTRDNLDFKIRNMDNFALQLNSDSQINRILNLEEQQYGSKDIKYIYDFSNTIYSNSIQNNIDIKNLSILLRESHILFNSETASLDAEFYYNNFWRYEGYNYEEFYNKVFEIDKKMLSPQSRVYSNGESLEVLTYIFPIRQNLYGEVRGVMLFQLEVEELLELLNEAQISGNGWVSLMTPDTVLMSTIPKEIEQVQEVIRENIKGKSGCFSTTIEKEEMIVAYVKSEYSDLCITAVLPHEMVLKEVKYIKDTFLMFIGIYIVVGILIALWFAKKNVKPIHKLIDYMKQGLDVDRMNSKSEYDILEYGISVLTQRNESVQKSLVEKNRELHSIFFERLLNGGFKNNEQINSLKESIEIIGLKNKFFCITIQLKERSVQEIIYTLTNLNTRYNIFIHKIDEYMIAMIIELGDEIRAQDKDIRLEVVKEIVNGLVCFENLRGNIGIGMIYNQLIEVQYTYKESLSAQYNITDTIKTWNIGDYKEFIHKKNVFYYPVDLEYKLILATKAAEVEGVKGIFDNLYNENFRLRSLELYMQDLLMQNLKSTYIKIVNNINERLLNNLCIKEDAEEQFKELRDEFLELVVRFDNNKQSHNKDLKNMLLDYIEKHYTDSNLSIAKIAHEYNMSESYFSQFFKEQVAEKFSTYLEQKRINKAQDIIKENPDIDLQSVAQGVGYNSAHTFRRAFKKVTGIMPSQYKKSI